MVTKERFLEIKEYFDALDNKKTEKEEKLVYETDKGIFGTSDIQDIHTWLEGLDLKEDSVFLDLGSGDGRVNIVADLFCISRGVEFDPQLVTTSLEHCKTLKSNATIHQGDYEHESYKDVDVLFCYADHDFSKELVAKLIEEFHGTLYIYQGVYFPSGAEKQKTTWIGQTPIMAYTFE